MVGDCCSRQRDGSGWSKWIIYLAHRCLIWSSYWSFACSRAFIWRCWLDCLPSCLVIRRQAVSGWLLDILEGFSLVKLLEKLCTILLQPTQGLQAHEERIRYIRKYTSLAEIACGVEMNQGATYCAAGRPLQVYIWTILRSETCRCWYSRVYFSASRPFRLIDVVGIDLHL